jgi:hypothetical protein
MTSQELLDSVEAEAFTMEEQTDLNLTKCLRNFK